MNILFSYSSALSKVDNMSSIIISEIGDAFLFVTLSRPPINQLVGYLAFFYADWQSTSCEAERSERTKEKQVKESKTTNQRS